MAASVRAAAVASVSARGQQRRLIAPAQAGGLLLLLEGTLEGTLWDVPAGRGGKVVSRLRCCSPVGTCWTGARSPVKQVTSYTSEVAGGGRCHVVVLLRFWSFSLITLAAFMLTSKPSTVMRFRLHQGTRVEALIGPGGRGDSEEPEPEEEPWIIPPRFTLW